MNHFFIRMYPPQHPMGHVRLWFWQVCSMGDVEMSGTSDDRDDAWAVATNALEDVMEKEIKP